MRNLINDDFQNPPDWVASSSGQGHLHLSSGTNGSSDSLQLNFDFKEKRGFVAIKKNFSVSMPENYCFTFNIHGDFPIKVFELKLVDPSGHNVWWYRSEHFPISQNPNSVTITHKQIEFAWGPLGNNTGPIQELGSVEFVFWADTKEKGTIWIKNFQLIDTTPKQEPIITSSSEEKGHEAHWILGRNNKRKGWRSQKADLPQWIEVDFQQNRDYGGMVIHWDPDHQIKKFNILSSHDGKNWTELYQADQVKHCRSYIYLPDGSSRFLKFNLIENWKTGPSSIQHIEIKPYDFSRSFSGFFQNITHYEPKGFFPKYLYGEQSYWTVIKSPSKKGAPALINEEGMVEVKKGSFSLEPFLFYKDQLITWNQAKTDSSLERHLPLPHCTWATPNIQLTITPFIYSYNHQPVLYVRYQLKNTTAQTQNAQLLIAIRPFQVTPPWQNFLQFGGISKVCEIDVQENRSAVKVSDEYGNQTLLIPLNKYQSFKSIAFEQGTIDSFIKESDQDHFSEKKCDHFGFASGAFIHEFSLAPGESEDFSIAIPQTSDFSSSAFINDIKNKNLLAADQFQLAKKEWETKLSVIDIQLPPSEMDFVSTLKVAASHVLINRVNGAFHPGPRRYSFSWIRDGAMMAAASLRFGWREEALQFIRWYAKHQAADGNVPFAVDNKKDHFDPLENDSSGQMIYGIAECYRMTHDRDFLKDLWPTVALCVKRIESLRAQRRTDQYLQPENRAYYDLIPESVSHEGYLFQPVHSYWDDFWTLRGLIDAIDLAKALNHQNEEKEFKQMLSSFQDSVKKSLELTCRFHDISYVPGSVELGDFDPGATAIVGTILPDKEFLQQKNLALTFKKYLEDFELRHSRSTGEWINYTPYEMRIFGTLAKMGWREEAYRLAKFFLSERTPLNWNQWPEIIWKNKLSPAHLGDLPHTWVGTEYIFSFLSLLAFERLKENDLVLAAGVPKHWLKDGGVHVHHLPTYFGPLSYSLVLKEEDCIFMSIANHFSTKPNKIVIEPPSLGQLKEVIVNGKTQSHFDPHCLAINDFPADIILKYSLSS